MLRHLYEPTETPQTAVRAHLTAEASEVCEAEHAAISNAVADSESLTPAFASHLGKHSGIVSRVALTFHLLKQERTEGVSAATVEMAIRFMRTARRHAAALFLDILQGSPVRELARSMGPAIAAGTDVQQPLSRAWLSSHCAHSGTHPTGSDGPQSNALRTRDGFAPYPIRGRIRAGLLRHGN